MIGKRAFLPFAAFALLAAAPVTPALVPSDAVKAKLAACMKKADDYPDMAAADAEAWLKRGGGDQARLCHATAQFNRGEFAASGKEFAYLAHYYDKADPKQSLILHTQAGLGYARAHDDKKAEPEFAIAMKLSPNDPSLFVDRAIERAEVEHYWDAIDDLNHAIALKPDLADAYHLRGQAWLRLGNTKNAQADWEKAAALQPQPIDTEPAKPEPVKP